MKPSITFALVALILSHAAVAVDLVPSVGSEVLKKQALEAIAAQYPAVKQADLRLFGVDMKYGFVSEWPLSFSEKPVDPVAVLTFLIVPTRVEGQDTVVSDKGETIHRPKVTFDTLQVSLYYERKPLQTTVHKQSMASILETTGK